MPLFLYKAKSPQGKIVEDALQASSKEDAASILKTKNLSPLVIRSPKISKRSIFSKRISVAEKAALCRFVATMIRSGMSIPESVDIIGKETKNKRLKKILADISYQTQKGQTISSVISRYKNDFSSTFITTIRSGEQSGTLDKAFDYLSQQLTASYDLSQKVKGSLMYPAVIIFAMIANSLLMGVFVLPKISSAFLKLDMPLPPYTKFILQIGQFSGEHSLGVLLVTFLVIASLIAMVFIKSTRDILLALLGKIPAISKILEMVDIARFSRTLSTLLKSAVPITEALDVAADTLTRGKYKKQAKGFSAEVAKGVALSDILIQKKGIFPSTMIQTIKAGEKTGSLEKVLEELADFYEKEVDFALKRFTSLLEPVLMLAIGIVVGAMVLIMIAPIYSIIGSLQNSVQK
jgi:type IV pilus assembly protein PilC